VGIHTPIALHCLSKLHHPIFIMTNNQKTLERKSQIFAKELFIEFPNPYPYQGTNYSHYQLIIKRNLQSLYLQRKGFSYGDLSKIFGISRQAVHQSLRRFVVSNRELLDDLKIIKKWSF